MNLQDNETTEIETIRNEAQLLLDKANEVAMVSDATSESRAVEFLKQVKMRADLTEDARVRLVKPLKDHAKMIDQEFKKTSEPLEEAERIVKAGMVTYRQSTEFRALEAKRKAVEQDAREAIREGNTAKLAVLAEEHKEASADAPVKVQSQSGEARYRKVWHWEIDNLEKLPAAYWMPDEKKIATAVKAGITVEGVKAWQTEEPSIY